MVIFTSDNGPETTWKQRIEKYSHHSAGPFREGKRSIYEGGHRVPFFIRWPAKVTPGSTWDLPVCQTDLLSTFASILKKPLPENAAEDSISFDQAWWERKVSSPPRPPLIHHAANGRFAIRYEGWKLVMEGTRKTEKRELYDLGRDPGEKNNVLTQHPDVEKKLLGQLNAIITRGATRAAAGSRNDTPPLEGPGLVQRLTTNAHAQSIPAHPPPRDLPSSLVSAKPPNILIILVDDLGYGDLGSYNPNSKIPTPHLDTLSSEGMRFTDAHAPGPLCHLSRYGLMTGQYPFRADTNSWRKKPSIKKGQLTVASLLKENGFGTAMVGKWHLGFKENGYENPFPGGPVDVGFRKLLWHSCLHRHSPLLLHSW